MKFLLVASFFCYAYCLLPPGPNILNTNKDSSNLNRNMLCAEEECDHSKELICANNGKTYNSRCAFKGTVCQDGSFIEFKHFGKCTVQEQCIGQRATALLNSKRITGVFVPECNSDGTFAPLQCHNYTMFCWCMSPSGDIIPNTPTRIKDIASKEGMPNCTIYSGTPKRTRGDGSKSPSYRPQGGCEGRRRKKFNKNMFKHMEQDIMRDPISDQLTENVTSKDKLKIITLQWKFSQMDKDSNGFLKRKEYLTLRKLTRKHVKPRRCAKKFPTFCDIDSDERLSKEEWIICFTTIHTPTPKNNSKKKKGKKFPKLGISELRYPEPCFRERNQTLEASKISQHEMFVPDCNKKGYFKRVQCYGSSGKKLWYCFCVDEFSGKMIENTSVQNGNPTCPASRRWPGCPPPKKQKQLLERLISFFLKEAILIDSNSAYSIETSKEEWALKTIFSKFDTNSNNYIDKKERKRLRKFVRKDRKLRKCGGKIYKVCDGNNDKKISQEELIECILPRAKIQQNKATQEQKRRNLKGKNPFVHIIKSE